MQKTKAKPFLKWVGGKNGLLKQFDAYYPKNLKTKNLKNYVEPFLGGGAMFFQMAYQFDIETAYLSDANKDLILAYKVIQKRLDDLLDFLERYQKKYDQTPQADRTALFLKVRENFNAGALEINYKKIADNWTQRAAQLIFLNKTCFNGLYRLNKKGAFNVPFGKYKTALIFDEDNMKAVSNALQKAEIKCADYTNCFDRACENSFVYFDPPYRPISKTASFTTYTGIEFKDAEQINLAKFFQKLDRKKNAKLMLSNSDPQQENPDDTFFERVYAGYNIFKVSANRAINCKGNKRGKINELLITNYKYENIKL